MKKPLYRALCSLATIAVALTASMPAYSLDDAAQAAKDEGMRLYNAYQRSKSEPYLKTAAEAGDVEAMYYLGEVYRLRHMGLTNDAKDWYYEAAQHGEPYAMLRLHSGGACKLGDVCPDNGDDWRDAALEETLPKAEDGDTDAMLALYSIYSNYATLEDMNAANHWLLEAAEADNTDAQDWLGKRIRDGESGTRYTNDTERREAAEVLFRRAAELGYPPSMSNLAGILANLERYDEAWEWMEKASDAGHMNGRMWLVACNIVPNNEENELCNGAPPPNPAEGWAIALAINEEVPNTYSSTAWYRYRQIVTPEKREEGEAMKDEWLNLAPLSYFPDKFGF
ncbi:tetratricopeptide repeat protein [Vreelandella sp. TE19]